MSELTHDDVQQILKIIDEMGDREVHLEIGELKLHISPGGSAPASASTQAARAAPVQPPADAAAPAAPGAPFEVPPGHVAVRAPTMGMFYRAATPGAKPYAEIGDHVGPEDAVCVFEVMKLFSTLKAGVAGTVTAIPLANETLVEPDQPLIVIKPD
ncbi:MAG: acetyl-CoA carboxylase biotin carboxyl carrier protein [Betaproteobacteria bacterium]|nr:acetyl-CoA carboxylase biotin carboxyl carrier protein [Betaproteobacteria bacterium]